MSSDRALLPQAALQATTHAAPAPTGAWVDSPSMQKQMTALIINLNLFPTGPSAPPLKPADPRHTYSPYVLRPPESTAGVNRSSSVTVGMGLLGGNATSALGALGKTANNVPFLSKASGTAFGGSGYVTRSKGEEGEVSYDYTANVGAEGAIGPADLYGGYNVSTDEEQNGVEGSAGWIVSAGGSSRTGPSIGTGWPKIFEVSIIGDGGFAVGVNPLLFSFVLKKIVGTASTFVADTNFGTRFGGLSPYMEIIVENPDLKKYTDPLFSWLTNNKAQVNHYGQLVERMATDERLRFFRAMSSDGAIWKASVALAVLLNAIAGQRLMPGPNVMAGGPKRNAPQKG